MSPPLSYQFGPFRLDQDERVLRRDGQPVPLRPKDFDLLLVLVENNGRVLEKDALLKRVWPDSFVEEANLSHHVFTLRKALGEDQGGSRYIETIPRRGYRFIAHVSATSDTKTDAAREEEPSPRRTRTRLLLVACAVVVGLAMAGYFAARRYLGTAAATRRSIAVLPFKPLVAADGDESLGLGMADTLIARLATLGELSVRPIGAVRGYRNLEQDPVMAGRELRVDAVLDGSIQRAGDQIRMTVRLLKVDGGQSLWAETFNERFTNIFAIQDVIAAKVAAAVLPRLTEEVRLRVSKRDTDDAEAYRAYILGRYLWNKRTPESLKKSVDYFRQAIDRDTKYARAYAGLADSLAALSINADAPVEDSFVKAKAAALKTFELDEGLVEAHATLIFVKDRYDWDWSGVEREYRRSVELDPLYSMTHFYYTNYLMENERHSEAIAEIRRAQRLDPTSLIIGAIVGRTFYFARQYDDAIEACLKALELDPHFWVAHYFLGRAYLHKGTYRDALTELNRAKDLSGGISEATSLIGYVYAASGEKRLAHDAIVRLKEMSKRQYVPPYHTALIYAALGEKDAAFEWLDRAFADRNQWLTLLRVDPELDNLRSDSRFVALEHRIGLVR